ncbi:glutamate--tRNA ligase [Syntrophomonas erecta]
MENVRVRFAPSPTGSLHIGGARTALFNWLFAKSQGGKFILRLEDTDTTRSTGASVQGIIEGLQWLGLSWDEGPGQGGPYGPYRQSERLSIYQHYAQQLLDNDKAYYCFCTPEELKAEREQAQANKTNYRHQCPYRHLSNNELKALSGQQNFVIRLKVPTSGITIVNDLIRGEVQFDNALMDDFIIVKSDGWPTYNFAVVVDDYTMHISHVIRAEEHLSNTPKQIHIYQALDFVLPKFAHVSMILAPDRSKLSKRHGATSVQEFRDLGYLPSALVNYLALLGWSTGQDVDILAINEMINNFNLNNVSRSAAIYDVEKLTWMNGYYLNQMPAERIVEMLKPEAINKGWLTTCNQAYFTNVVELIKSRIKTIAEFFHTAEYFFQSPSEYDAKGVKKYLQKENSLNLLNEVLDLVQDCNPYQADEIEKRLRNRAEQLSVKAGDLIHPTRLALSGRTSTPGLFEVMEVLGKEVCIKRLQKAIHYTQSFS